MNVISQLDTPYQHIGTLNVYEEYNRNSRRELLVW